MRKRTVWLLLADGVAMRYGNLFGVLAGAVWGIVFLVPALLPEFSPLLLSSGRYIMYGLFSLLLALPWLPGMLRKITRQDLGLLVKLALTGNLIYYLGLATAVQMSGVAVTSLIIGTTPVVITLLLRRDAGALPLRLLAWPIAMVLAGVLLINLDLMLSPHAQERPMTERLIGLFAAVAAVLSWAWYAAHNARFLKSQTRFNDNQWSLLWGIVTGALGGLIWLLVWLLPGDVAGLAEHTARGGWLRFWTASLGVAIVCSWFGNWMWNAAARRLPVTLGGQMLVFETLFALLYGFIWAERWPTWLEVVTILLLVGGVVFAARRHVPPKLALGEQIP